MIDFGFRAWPYLALPIVALAIKLSGRAIYAHFVRTTTILPYLENLGRSRHDGKFPGTALVAGGSMAGLLTARVLSDHFENVMVVEPDPVLAPKRTRVAQWNQPHAWLELFRLILYSLFTDAEEEIVKAGIILDRTTFNQQFEGKTLRGLVDKVPISMAASRVGMETLVRRLVSKHCPNITFLRGSVTGLVSNVDGSRIAAAHLRVSDGSASQEREVPLAFFADCTGPACGAMKWLPRANAGWGSISRDYYDPTVFYAALDVPITSQLVSKFEFERPYDEYGFIRRIQSSSTCPGPARSYGLARLEGERLLVVAMQYGVSDGMPENMSEFVDYCEALEAATSREPPFPGTLAAFRAVCDEDPDAPLSRMKLSGLYHIRYDALGPRALPANFAVCGDAVMRLNPLFGQGCTQAGIHATCLDVVLRAASTSSGEVPVGLSHAVLKMQTALTRPMFDNNRWLDYQHSTTVPMAGETTANGGLFRLFFKGVMRLAQVDDEAGNRFLNVSQQVAPAASLMHPWFVARVLWNACFQ